MTLRMALGPTAAHRVTTPRYQALAFGELAARQAELESESTNVGADSAAAIQQMQDMAATT